MTYFTWLCDKISLESYSRYTRVLKALWDYDFTFIRWPADIYGDNNRICDGLYLRTMYYDETGCILTEHISNRNCSVLEVLVALALRMDAIFTDISAQEWFWEMVSNLFYDLEKYSDDTMPKDREIRAIILDFVNRKYSSNGVGGVFPLKHPNHDQRKIELWYQMQNYIEEQIEIDDLTGAISRRKY